MYINANAHNYEGAQLPDCAKHYIVHALQELMSYTSGKTNKNKTQKQQQQWFCQYIHTEDVS